MNSTELDSFIQAAIVNFHHVTGVIFFSVNMLVCLLILFDRDPRGRSYRKYLLLLQCSSLLLDLNCNLYTPILQLNNLVIYSDSRLAQIVGMSAFLASFCSRFSEIEMVLLTEVLNVYFLCVYYRRDVSARSINYYKGVPKVLRFFSIKTFIITSSTARASAIIFCMITTHTFAHSLTIVACSPNYRRMILQFL
ncbi:hypothetical protein PFISCL1PPCAC_12760, partial [Pristionchus fissidentatus]